MPKHQSRLSTGHLEKLNDDMFRVILSFLSIPDLCNLELVSKQTKICTLSTEDQFWKNYYFQKIELYLEKTNSYINNYNSNTRVMERVVQYSEIYNRYHSFNSNFKKHLLELIGDFMSKAEKHDAEKTKQIKQLSQQGKDVYIPKDEMLKYNLKSNVDSDPLKIVQVGDGAVGKTCLWISFVDKFPTEYIPTVFDNFMKNCSCDGKNFNLALWDTSSVDDFDRLRPLTYLCPPADLFLLSFSCESEFALDNIYPTWIPELRHYCPDTPIILVCNKIDLRDDPVFPRQLLAKKQRKLSSFEQGELLAKRTGCISYVETSALKGIGLSDLCEVMIKAIHLWKDPSLNQIVKKNRDINKKCIIQ